MTSEEKELALQTIGQLKSTLVEQYKFAPLFSTILNQPIKVIEDKQIQMEKGLYLAEKIIAQYQPANAIADSVFCLCCKKQTTTIDFVCKGCRQVVCSFCGCTESNPCAATCESIQGGVCDDCGDLIREDF